MIRTVNGLHSKVVLICRALPRQVSSECGFHGSFAAVATSEGDTGFGKRENFRPWSVTRKKVEIFRSLPSKG